MTKADPRHIQKRRQQVVDMYPLFISQASCLAFAKVGCYTLVKLASWLPSFFIIAHPQVIRSR